MKLKGRFLVIKFQFLMNLMYPSKVGSTIQMYKKFMKSHGSWSKWQPKKKRLSIDLKSVCCCCQQFWKHANLFPFRKFSTKKKFLDLPTPFYIIQNWMTFNVIFIALMCFLHIHNIWEELVCLNIINWSLRINNLLL